MPEVPLLHHVHDYLTYHAEGRGTQDAVVCGEVRLSYSELLDRVRACASGLLAAGIRPGDRVATLADMQVEFLITFLATSMVGGVWMGLNPRYRRHELAHLLADGRPKLLFTITRSPGTAVADEIDASLESAGDSVQEVVLLDDGSLRSRSTRDFAGFMNAPEPDGELDRRSSRSGREPVLLVYTSGTTGKPKGALLTHEGLIARALNQNRMWPCDPIRVVNHLPINHIGGVGFISFYCLVGGGTQILDLRFDPESFISRLTEERITIWVSLPTIILKTVAHPDFSPARLPHLRWIVWSGAALPVATVRTLRAVGCGIGSSYGLTESSGSVCYATDDLDDETLSRTIGRAVPPGEVRLAGPDGDPVRQGETGEIQLRPEWAMAGYLGQEAASRDALTGDGFVRTGDLGREDADGCIELVGRLKEMFKSGGFNVYPREVELAIEEHPAVAACAVVSMPDPVFQEVGIAFVQTARPGSLVAGDLQAWCASRLAHYKVPKQFRLLETLPVLSIGKVDRHALRLAAAKPSDLSSSRALP